MPAQRKNNPKGFAPAYGTSLRLSVPSLRCPSGGIAYGLLRCTSSRCMRLRAYPLMNTFARPAEGAEGQKPHQEPHQKPKPKQIKRSQPSAAPTWDWVHSVGGWSAVRPPSRAGSLLQLDWVRSVGGWSAVRPPSRAGSLLQLDWVRSVGGWSAVRPPSRAGSLIQLDWVHSVRDWSAVRPPSLASQLPQKSTADRSRFSPLNRMSVSSAAALDLKGPFGRLSGGVYPGVGAQRPFGAAKHIERRCSEANRRRCARMNPVTKEPEPRRGPNAGAQRFGYFLAFEKVTRCKSGTASGNTQKNGYSQRTPKAWSAQRPPRHKKKRATEVAQNALRAHQTQKD